MDATSPSFQIDFCVADYGLRAHVSGVGGNPEITLAYWRRIAQEVRRVHPAGLLVVDDMKGERPLSEQLLLQLLQAMQGEGIETVRVAYVENHLGRIPQVERASILANISGFHGHVFDNERSALTWLRYGEW